MAEFRDNGPDDAERTKATRAVQDADYVRPLRRPKLRSIASGWDWEEDPLRSNPETLEKLRALDDHVGRAMISARTCWVRR